MGRDVSKFCLLGLNEGMNLESVNSISIILLSKMPHPISLMNFKPISLCNVIYKVIAKMLENRMKMFMEVCINPVQSAFIPGCLISDNVLLAYEVLHTYQQKRIGKKCFMTLKLDMSKAYYRVE